MNFAVARMLFVSNVHAQSKYALFFHRHHSNIIELDCDKSLSTFVFTRSIQIDFREINYARLIKFHCVSEFGMVRSYFVVDRTSVVGAIASVDSHCTAIASLRWTGASVTRRQNERCLNAIVNSNHEAICCTLRGSAQLHRTENLDSNWMV